MKYFHHLQIIQPEETVEQPIENGSSSGSGSNIISSASSISGFMSQVKGGAESLFKNIKQNIKIHQQNFQQHSQGQPRSNRPPSMLTSKIVVMISPSSSTGSPFFRYFQQNDDNPIRLSNLSFYNLNKANKLLALPPPIRVVEAGTIYNLSNEKCPTLECLQILVDDIFAFLATNPSNMVVVQNDDVNLLALILAALLMFSGLVENPEDALQICAVKLNFDLSIRPSQNRYLHYLPKMPAPQLTVYVEVIMCKFLNSQKSKFNRLFLELYGKSDQVVLSTEAEISPNGELAKFPIAMSLNGDLTVVFYHSNGGSKNRVGQIQFNTAFESKSSNQNCNIYFSSKDIDDSKNEFRFDVKVSVTISNQNEEVKKTIKPKPFLSNRNPNILFSSNEEYDQMLEVFGPKQTKDGGSSVDEDNFVFIDNGDEVIINCDKEEVETNTDEIENTFGNLVDLGVPSAEETTKNDSLGSNVPIIKSTELDDIFGFNQSAQNNTTRSNFSDNSSEYFKKIKIF